MAGTHYTLDRDVVRMVPREKPCRRCGTMYPNTFEFFGKKWFGNRKTYTTVDVCIKCKTERLAETLKKKADEKRTFEEGLEADRLKLITRK